MPQVMSHLGKQMSFQLHSGPNNPHAKLPYCICHFPTFYAFPSLQWSPFCQRTLSAAKLLQFLPYTANKNSTSEYHKEKFTRHNICAISFQNMWQTFENMRLLLLTSFKQSQLHLTCKSVCSRHTVSQITGGENKQPPKQLLISSGQRITLINVISERDTWKLEKKLLTAIICTNASDGSCSAVRR